MLIPKHRMVRILELGIVKLTSKLSSWFHGSNTVFFFLRYFMVLIQEMALKIDQGFLGAIIALVTPSADPESEKQKVVSG